MPKELPPRDLAPKLIDSQDGPIASPERAREIAESEVFGLPEFIELTGIGVGNYGIYLVSSEGVNLRASADDASQPLAPEDQLTLLRAEKRLSLQFPCTPERFQDWYDATRGQERDGQHGASDFPLAHGFLKARLRSHGTSRAQFGPPVPASKIIAAFSVKAESLVNRRWWKDRMRGAIKFGLTEARARAGRARRPSQWYPSLVAGWLVDKGHLGDAEVRRAMETHFPDTDYL